MFALTPVAVLAVGGESALRICGFRFNPHDLNRPVFERSSAGYIETSDFFTDETRFVPSPFCVPQRLPAIKPPGTTRVALLGASSVYLLGTAEDLAEQIRRTTGKPVEVLNFGLLGCGSDRVVLAAREALELDADIVVVYCGHNTFTSFSDPRCYSVPPFGLRGVVRHSRVVQAAWYVADRVQRQHNPAVHPGTQNFFAQQKTYSEAEKQQRYREFEEHLREIARLCQRARRRLIFSTLAYNVLLPPYVHGSRFELSQVKGMSTNALEAWLQQRPTDLLVKHELGLRRIAAGDLRIGHELIEQVFVESPRPDRANRRINDIANRVAREAGICLVDGHQIVEQVSPRRLPGSELLNDNCHLNDAGNRLLIHEIGRIICEQTCTVDQSAAL
ncbi:MAG: SGNH/GDSL hydrolase family protein [Pirellulales bacterium]|nr:SGNH/GDSL hydrolase family protein [Pirellulales bacterium]